LAGRVRCPGRAGQAPVACLEVGLMVKIKTNKSKKRIGVREE